MNKASLANQFASIATSVSLSLASKSRRRNTFRAIPITMADETSQVLPWLGSAAKPQDNRILAHATAHSDVPVNLMTPLLQALHQEKLPLRRRSPGKNILIFP